MPKSADSIADSNADSYINIKCQMRIYFFTTFSSFLTTFGSISAKKQYFMLFYPMRMLKNADSIADSIADSNAVCFIDVKCQQKILSHKNHTFGHFLGVKLHKIVFLSFQCGFFSNAGAEPDADSNTDLFFATLAFLKLFSALYK